MEKTGKSFRVSIRFSDQKSDAIREDIFIYSKIGGQWVKIGRASSQ